MSAAALSAEALLKGRQQFAEWETLTPADAEGGDFLMLSDGSQLHFVVRGPQDRSADSQTLVLLHGLMSSIHEWDKNIDGLAERHRVYALDLIGFGFSSRVCEPCYSLKYYSRTVLEFLDAQEIAHACLVGHSLGGGIALQVAHDAPERVNKLILVDAAAYIFGLVRVVRLATRVPYLSRGLARRVFSNPRVYECGLRNALGDPRHLDPEAVALRLRAARVKGSVDALFAMLASPHAAEQPEGLRQMAKPTLILWGDRDYVLPLRHGQRLARELPNARLVTIRGAGHVPNAEYPEAVNRLILDFVG